MVCIGTRTTAGSCARCKRTWRGVETNGLRCTYRATRQHRMNSYQPSACCLRVKSATSSVHCPPRVRCSGGKTCWRVVGSSVRGGDGYPVRSPLISDIPVSTSSRRNATDDAWVPPVTDGLARGVDASGREWWSHGNGHRLWSTDTTSRSGSGSNDVLHIGIGGAGVGQCLIDARSRACTCTCDTSRHRTDGPTETTGSAGR